MIRQFISTVLDSFNGSSSGLTLGSFEKQCHPDPQIISGTVIRKKSEDLFNYSLTASSTNKMSAYSVNSVNKIFLTLSPFRPMPNLQSDMSLMRLRNWCECY